MVDDDSTSTPDAEQTLADVLRLVRTDTAKPVVPKLTVDTVNLLAKAGGSDALKKLQENIAVAINSGLFDVKPSLPDMTAVNAFATREPQVVEIDESLWAAKAQREREQHEALVALPQLITVMNSMLEAQIQADKDSAWQTTLLGVMAAAIGVGALVPAPDLPTRALAAVAGGALAWVALWAVGRIRRARRH